MALAHDVWTKLPASLLDALPDAVLASDPAGSIVYANARCDRLFRYERGELVGQAVKLVLPAGLPDLGQSAGRPTVRGRTKDGGERLLELSMSTLEGGGEPLTVADLREGGAAARQRDDLRRSEAAFRTVLEGLPDAVVASRPDGLIAFVNERASELFGYDAEELVGAPVDRLWPERLRERYSRNMQSFLS